MKTKFLLVQLAAIMLVTVTIMLAGHPGPSGKKNPGGSSDFSREKQQKGRLMQMKAEYLQMKLADPATGKIPSGIRARELDFVSGLPHCAEGEQTWNWRGPANIGGRMLCVKFDVDNPDHLLAGSASGGMWESIDGAASWHKVTPPEAEQSATCLVQDLRPGKHSVWYYGTGEMLSTTDRNVSTNARTYGIGNGIFKSTDNGASWQPIPSTTGASPAHLTDVFQGVWRIATDPVRIDQDIVYAACYGAILRSANGGDSWEVVLGDLENKAFCTDIAITPEGVLYAALSSFGLSIEPPDKAGIWRSEDGFSWTKITPEGFPNDNRVTKLALAPSNENVLYVFTESQNPDLNPFNGYTNTLNTFWKMTWNPEANAAVWEDRTTGMPGAGDGSINNFPYALVVYGGYCVDLGVKPDDENVVFLGGMNMYRSGNGFADSLMTTYIGGYPYDMDSIHALHPDEHGIAFQPGNPSVMMVANDGGIYRTSDCMADSAQFSWERLNNQLVSTQFYSVAIDHETTGNDWILGGLQDNNWYYTVTNNPSEFWFDIDICYDGFATAVAPGWEYSAITAYSGNLWTCRFDTAMHAIDIFPQLPDTLLKYYDPVMGSNVLFPFYQNLALDPVNYATLYLPTRTSIWRKDNLRAAAYDTGARNAGWSHLSNVEVGSASEISCLTVSKNPASRLYYGTNLGRLYRLDNAATGNPVPVEITGPEFPRNAFIAFIDTDPDNADHLMVTFSNYGVQSLFHSTDGGTTWIAVGGNLEENPDGSGDGPSIRCTKKLSYQGHTIIFAGTSCGLFSTTRLNGDSTVWVKEGVSTIGNVLVDMIETRNADGFIAVATQGNGVYSATYKPPTGIPEHKTAPSFSAGLVFPNPAGDQFSLEVSSDARVTLNASLYSCEGRVVKVFPFRNLFSGKTVLRFAAPEQPAGVYYLRLSDGTGTLTRKIILVK